MRIRERHPEFDAFWEEHKGLVYWVGSRLAAKFGGEREDYLGALLIHFNEVVYYFKEDGGAKFSTFFTRYAASHVFNDWLCFDSEILSLGTAKKKSRNPRVLAAEMQYEVVNMPQREFEQDSKYEAVLGQFENQDELWQFASFNLNERQLQVLKGHYKEGLTYRQLAAQMKISRQRVQQVHVSIIKILKERFKHVEVCKRTCCPATS